MPDRQHATSPHRITSGASGFTLIELSVVLVIVGLIVGGIVVAQNMKSAAELQRIITYETKYVEAAKQFKEKYGFLPGDFPNATSYWGTDPQGCPNVTQPAYTTPQTNTCNGNGDGQINGPGGGSSNAQQAYEHYRAWQQLADAGLIEGQYTGVMTTLSYSQLVPGQNIPQGPRTNSGYDWVFYTSTGNLPCGGTGCTFNVKMYQQYLSIGGAYGTDGTLDAALFTPAEALSIDTKVDDGYPGTGKWTTNNTEHTTVGVCTTSDSTSATYNTKNTQAWWITNFKSTQPACYFLVEVDW